MIVTMNHINEELKEEQKEEENKESNEDKEENEENKENQEEQKKDAMLILKEKISMTGSRDARSVPWDHAH